MTDIEVHASQNQDAEPRRQTSEDDDRKLMPERRRPHIAWKVLYGALFVVVVLYYGLYKGNVLKKIEFFCLGLFGIFITPIIQCLCDVVEEFRQYRIRYNRNICKLVKDCFSAVPWKTLIFAAGVSVMMFLIIRKVTNTDIFTLDDLMYILSAVVFGKVVTCLLSLDKTSNVGLSRLIEKLGLHPLQTLAWECFFHIERCMPMFMERFTSSDLSSQEQSDAVENPDRDRHTKIQVHLKKIILLVCDSFEMRLTLHSRDNDISEVFSDNRCPELPIYCLRYNGKEYKYVIICFKEPLETIKKACDSKTYKFLYGDKPKDHMDLFCNELSKILAGNETCKNMCILVSTTKATNSQQKGWLVKVIMRHIEADQGPPTTVVNIGRQPQETIDIEGQNGTTLSNDDKEKQCNTQDYPNPFENSDENSFLLTATNEKSLKRTNRRITRSQSSTNKSSTPKVNKVSRLVRGPSSNSSNKYDVRIKSTTSVLSGKQAQEDGKISFNSIDRNVHYKKEENIFADDLYETSSLPGEEQTNIVEGLPFPQSETNEQYVQNELDDGFNQLKSNLPEQPENAKPTLLPPSHFKAGKLQCKEKCGANDEASVSYHTVQAKSQATCGGHEIDEKENCLKEDKDIKHMDGL